MRDRRLDRRGLAAVAACGALLAVAAGAATAARGAAGPPSAQRTALGPATPVRPYVPGQVLLRLDGSRHTRAVDLRDGLSVRTAASALRRKPSVRYAVPNYIATASAFVPNDPGTLTRRRGSSRRGWTDRQWNFLPCGSLCGDSAQPYESLGGIDAISAWRHLRAARRGGAAGVRIAVLDSGIAYRAARGGFARSPDFAARRFSRGYDFVDDDRIPLDQNGHGTHVAGTIGEDTGNGIGVTGLAYRSKLIPVRVLDSHLTGQADEIARGIRFAANHNADVINMSFNFPCKASVPDVTRAIRFAHAKGAVLVASEGNAGAELCISSPATEPHVISVGGTTDGACPAFYSIPGADLDLVAPGGGTAIAGCSGEGDPIVQMTLRQGSLRRFALPGTYVGTSMAAAHVSGVAAMVIASGALGRNPTPAAVARRLRQTARDLGPPGRDLIYGAGLLDAGAATSALGGGSPPRGQAPVIGLADAEESVPSSPNTGH